MATKQITLRENEGARDLDSITSRHNLDYTDQQKVIDKAQAEINEKCKIELLQIENAKLKQERAQSEYRSALARFLESKKVKFEDPVRDVKIEKVQNDPWAVTITWQEPDPEPTGAKADTKGQAELKDAIKELEQGKDAKDKKAAEKAAKN